jgi:hypothetical protein
MSLRVSVAVGQEFVSHPLSCSINDFSLSCWENSPDTLLFEDSCGEHHKWEVEGSRYLASLDIPYLPSPWTGRLGSDKSETLD